MCIRFKIFRHILCLLIALTAIVTLVLSIILSRSILRRGFAWLLVIVELLSIIRSIWSVLRRPASGSCQPVASEAISLFTLFPFQLIIVFVISTFPLQHQHDTGVFFAMQAFAIASAAIHLIYTSGIVILATLTVKAFDKDVWIRDIDNTPSPFPLPVVFAFIFPCLAHFFESTRPFITPGGAQNVMCLSGCTCGRKGCDPTVHGTSSQERLTETVPSVISNITTRLEINNLDEALIRVPNAAERRACIFLNLDIQ